MQNDISSFTSPSLEIAFQGYIRKTYLWMMAGLLISGVTAYLASHTLLAFYLIVTPMLFYLIIFAELGLVWYLSTRVMKLHGSTAGLLFVLYSFLNGLTLSIIFLVYVESSIQNVFFTTAALFAAMSFYGYTTKRNLTSLGSFLLMGLMGIIIASIINLFLASSALEFTISIIGVLVFVGLTAYDTQKIKAMLYELSDDQVALGKYSILAALTL
ncbi:MAG: Bax inhibitor-1 family protein, partial [Candidatus Kapaibacteriota bacterium]